MIWVGVLLVVFGLVLGLYVVSCGRFERDIEKGWLRRGGDGF